MIFFQNEEFYVCIYSHRSADTILFHHEGGIDIGDVDAKVIQLIGQGQVKVHLNLHWLIDWLVFNVNFSNISAVLWCE